MDSRHATLPLLALLSCVQASCQFASPYIGSVQTMPKQFYADEDYVRMEGRWKSIGRRTGVSRLIPVINTAEIRCDRQARICIETVGMLYSRNMDKDDRPGLDPWLSVPTFEYEIVEWTPNLVRAVVKQPVADIELRISLADKSAERSRRETTARGSETADPNVYEHWVLE